MNKCKLGRELPRSFPPQHQATQPGIEAEMYPRPVFDNPCYCGSGKLKGRTALITGGDSGIGRAVAVAFAKEGADIGISFFDETLDAQETRDYIEALGSRCLLLPGDIRCEAVCREAVKKTVECFGRLDVLVNNSGVQFPQNSVENITEEQIRTTFEINVFPMFYFVKAALPYMTKGGAIVNTASVTAYRGEADLIDYSATKGAVVSYTRALSQSLVKCGIRVNAVAPGPIWTPLIVSSFSEDKVAAFGQDVPMGRAGQPFELAPAYVYLASDDSSYVTGQVIHVNGGSMVES